VKIEIMVELISAISVWCSLGMNSLSGYYLEQMDKKMNCQKAIVNCITKANKNNTVFTPSQNEILKCLSEWPKNKTTGIE
jgi:hypothetical protein